MLGVGRVGRSHGPVPCCCGRVRRRRAWEAWECHDMAGWLSWKCAVSPVTAREQVRVARCLRCLPGLAERFGSGRLSYSQVRAITRAATPESVEVLAGMAESCTAAQLEAITRAWRRSRQAAQDAAGRRQAGRLLRYHYDDDGNLVGSFRLPAEAGAVLEAAIRQAVGRGDVDDAEVAGARDPRGAAAVEALVGLVGAGSQSCDLEGPSDSRYLLHVVDADVLAHPDADAERSQSAGVGVAGSAAGRPAGVLAADSAGADNPAGPAPARTRPATPGSYGRRPVPQQLGRWPPRHAIHPRRTALPPAPPAQCASAETRFPGNTA